MKTGNYLIFITLLVLHIGRANADTNELMQQCDGCHGENGVSQWTDMPTIAGLAEFTHADALFVYRDGDRPCADSEYRIGDTSLPATNMCDIAAELSDEQIDDIAAAYAELPYVKAKQDFDAALAAIGKEIHDQQCDRCHADAGMDPEDEAGMLGGQMAGYLRQTFLDYAAGERDQDKKMKEKMDALSDDDVAALLNYYASQQ